MGRLGKVLLSFLCLGLISCNSSSNSNQEFTSEVNQQNLVGSYSAKSGSLRISLTDKPNFDFSAVYVNIKHVEIWLEGRGKEARLIIAEGLGQVDLLQLRDGVLLPLADLELDEDIFISKIRLILEEDGHVGVGNNDDNTCDLQTPSGQQSGVKILLSEPVNIEAGYSYSMIIDFDAEKSVVVKGNGDCLLKPVIKIPSFSRVPSGEVPDGGGPVDEPDSEEPVTDGQDGNTDEDDSDNGGYDTDEPSNDDPDIIFDPDQF